MSKKGRRVRVYLDSGDIKVPSSDVVASRAARRKNVYFCAMVKTQSAFHTVGVIGRLGSELVVDSVKRLAGHLEERKVEVVVEKATAAMVPRNAFKVLERAEMGKRCDLVVVVGGDGSLLGVARDLVDHGVPLLGINRGGLGYLADIRPEDIEHRVGEVLSGNYYIEQHFLLEVEVYSGDRLIGRSSALNEVLVHSGSMSRMMEFALYINDEFVYDLHADGLIISTPTGSTAYALSAGGPIIHPSLDAIVVLPMFPHTLTSRPLVVGGDAEFRIELASTNERNPAISCDSQVDIPVSPGDFALVRKKQERLKLIYPMEHSFYDSLRSKLDWASRLAGRK